MMRLTSSLIGSAGHRVRLQEEINHGGTGHADTPSENNGRDVSRVHDGSESQAIPVLL